MGVLVEATCFRPQQKKYRDDELNGDFHVLCFLKIYAYYVSLKRTY